MTKLIKTRKEHKCCDCENTIPVKTECWYEESRGPKLSEESGFEEQIGIEYYKTWMCGDCYDSYYAVRGGLF